MFGFCYVKVSEGGRKVSVNFGWGRGVGIVGDRIWLGGV